ncbi:MAG TPA: hypothetical protein VL400_24195 [Polyangiaceae bacterium]|jgi:hypothetical protein|nr:hypothetical protein [Polyangiaceae bacterium]
MTLLRPWLAAFVALVALGSAGCGSPSDARAKEKKVTSDAWGDDGDGKATHTEEPTPSLVPAQNGALVYLVSDDDYLYSFDPRVPGKAAYASIGKLDCKAHGIPQSMAVDRHGIAWVFYGSGEMFRVSVSDASCTPTPYKHPSGFTQLGMGFTSASPGSSDDVLFVMSPAFGLATVAFPSLEVSQTGKTKLSAELTGGGDGRLFAFTAGIGEIGEIDRSTYEKTPIYTIKGMWNVRAWAFSRYAGRFYVFTARGFEKSTCTEIDVERHTEKVRDKDIGFVVVGAGQSTLVPPRDGGSALPQNGIREDFKP